MRLRRVLAEKKDNPRLSECLPTQGQLFARHQFAPIGLRRCSPLLKTLWQTLHSIVFTAVLPARYLQCGLTGRARRNCWFQGFGGDVEGKEVKAVNQTCLEQLEQPGKPRLACPGGNKIGENQTFSARKLSRIVGRAINTADQRSMTAEDEKHSPRRVQKCCWPRPQKEVNPLGMLRI
jgi:hypothetical protein